MLFDLVKKSWLLARQRAQHTKNSKRLFIVGVISVSSLLLLFSLDVGRPRPRVQYVMACDGDDFVLVDLGHECDLPGISDGTNGSSCVIATTSRKACSTLPESDTTMVWSREVVLDLQWLEHFCPASMSSCGHWDWDNPGHRTNAAVVFSVTSGAVRIVVLKGRLERLKLPVTHAENYVPVAHITGRQILNPLCKDHFTSKSLITLNMEKISRKLASVTHLIPKQEAPHLNATGDFLAVGGKSFVDASSATAVVFERDAFWAAVSGFCPGYTEPESALRESLVMQSVLWRLRRVVGVQLYEAKEKENVSVCRGEKNYTKATNNLSSTLHQLTTTCNASLRTCLEDILSELGDKLDCDLNMVRAFMADLANAAYRFPVVPKQKRFAYLVQGPNFDPSAPTDAQESSDGEVFRLAFVHDHTLGEYDIFYRKSTFNEGRNALIRMALSFERDSGYEFLVLMDDDARLTITTQADALWDKNVSSHPYRRLESFLLRFRPAVATTHFGNWHQYMNKTPSGPYTTVRHFDPCFNAYHRVNFPDPVPKCVKRYLKKAFGYVVLRGVGNSWETVGYFLPYYETSLDPLSWWYEGNVKYFIAASVYPENAVVHINSLSVSNVRNHAALTKYPDQNLALPVLTFLRNNFRANVSANVDRILEHEIMVLEQGLTPNRVRCDQAWWEFVLKVNYTDLIGNTTRLRRQTEGSNSELTPKPTYIVRDAVMNRLVETGELHSFISRWRNAPILAYSLNAKDLV